MTPERCPLCDRPRGLLGCVCGYDFEAQSPAKAFTRIAHARRRYHRVWRWGLFGTIVGFGGMLIGMSTGADGLALIYQVPMIIGLPFAIYGMVMDVVLSRRETRMRERVALPEARVV